MDPEVASPTENSTLADAKPSLTESPQPHLHLLENAQTRKERRTELVQLATLCGVLLISGWVDGSLGPLIPTIQNFYAVSYARVSLIFVCRCVGYVSGAFTNIFITHKFGFGKLVLLGPLLLIVGCAILAAAIAIPFEVFLCANLLLGFGAATQNSQAVGYVASIRAGQDTKMGIFQACYGVGCLIGPLAVTPFAHLKRRGFWALNFVIIVGLAALNLLALWAVFRGRTQAEGLARIGQFELEEHEKDKTAVADPPAPRSHLESVRKLMSLKIVHLLAFFLFIYVGTEVTLTGWIVTYMIQVRGGGPSSGYIPSGFWGGFVLGRIILLPLNKRVRILPVYIYFSLCIGLELIIWFVPNLIVDAVAVSLFGLFFGPIFVLGLGVAARTVPPPLLTSAVAWLSGISYTGASVIPLITGAIAGRAGIQCMQPV
ncbi:MFS domain-containing protein [Mycena kentingensis (nom. inval.)]|nr:MFS domain-containing protein [Mycena kentingensis (nom. inval.)]